MTDFIQSFVSLIPVTVAQSLILSFVVLAIMIPFRILNFPDLTSEGAYPLGGCVCALGLLAGLNPFAAAAVAMLAGFAAGCTTAFIHLRFRIHSLLAGILMMTMLYSVNLRLLGRSNLPVFNIDTMFSVVPAYLGSAVVAKIVVAGLIALAVYVVLRLYFLTERGTAMRAVGANPEMAEAQGINVWVMTIGGVGLAGSFSALSGAIMVQSQGFADVNMGLGILINGLAALMIGEAVVGKKTVMRQLLAPFAGTLIYYQLISLCLVAGLPPGDLKLATGLFVLLMLAAPTLRMRPQGVPPREAMKE
jgi:putative tryptophan/tyrosine transport system permease protein